MLGIIIGLTVVVMLSLIGLFHVSGEKREWIADTRDRYETVVEKLKDTKYKLQWAQDWQERTSLDMELNSLQNECKSIVRRYNRQVNRSERLEPCD